MKKEAVSDYYIFNNRLCSAANMEIFDKIGTSAIYEVIKIIDGIPLFFEAHMQRLRDSADFSGFKIKKHDREIHREILLLIKKNKCGHINVKLVTIPMPGIGTEPIESKPGEKDIFLVYFIHSEYPGKDVYEKGIHTILFEAQRPDPNIKTIKGSFRELVKNKREETGAYEALLVDKDGCICEGSRSNIFFLENNEIITPPGKNVLLGVTRQHVVKLCNDLGIKVLEKPIHINELEKIDGAFITGTTVDVLPVSSIGKIPVPSVSQTQIKIIIKEFNKMTGRYIEQQKNISDIPGK